MSEGRGVGIDYITGSGDLTQEAEVPIVVTCAFQFNGKFNFNQSEIWMSPITDKKSSNSLDRTPNSEESNSSIFAPMMEGCWLLSPLADPSES